MFFFYSEFHARYIFIFLDFVFLTKAQNTGGLTQTEPQNVYTQQSRIVGQNAQGNVLTTTSFSSNEIAANPSVANEGLKTYLGMGTPRRPQLAVALPRVGETMRKNKFNKTSNKTEKDISHKDDGSQRWRFTKIQGTDEHLKDIFMGKCWDYQIKFRLEKPVDCSELWEAFLSGFAYKEPCDTTLEDYKKFFEMIHEGPLMNRVSFYSSMVWKLGGSNISNK